MRLDMEVNVLIGIKYKLIHPEAIHTLPSGMTLYKCKLVSHNHGQNVMIRGPHFTFDCLREQAVGVANMVAKYRDEDCYAPRVPNDPAKEEPGNIGVNYQSCGVNYSCEDWIADCLVLTALEDDDTGEKIKRIRRKMQLMESGLDVDYRCIKCRECVQCKKSGHAEKISLREEQEM